MNRRNTIQKKLVAETVRMLDHPNAEEVYEAVTRQYPHISKATVYRNLNLLALQGEIGKVCVSEGADRFDYRTDRHYHMRCRVCGRLFDAPFRTLEQMQKLLGDTGGFTVEKYMIEFVGICSDCNKKYISEVTTDGKGTQRHQNGSEPAGSVRG